MHHLAEESGKSGTLQPHLRLRAAELQLVAHFLIQSGLQKVPIRVLALKSQGWWMVTMVTPPLAALSFRLIKDGVMLQSNLRVSQKNLV